MNTLENRILGLARSARATETEIPALPTAQELELARFSGDPASELRKRLTDEEGRANTERLAYLSRLMGSERAFDLIEGRVARNPGLAELIAPSLIETGLVVLDHTLFDQIELRSPALAAALLGHALAANSYLIDASALTSYALAHGFSLEWLCSWLDRRHALQGMLTGQALEELVLAFDAASQGRDIQGLIDLVTVNGAHAPVCRISFEDRQGLAADSRTGALLVALRYGCLLGEELATFATRRGALPVVLGSYPIHGLLEDYIRLSVIVAPETLMDTPRWGMSWLLSETEIHNTELLARAVTLEDNVRAWLNGSQRYRLNPPRFEVVCELITSGVIGLDELEYALTREWGYTEKDWHAYAVAHLPGVAELYRSLLGSSSKADQRTTDRLTPLIARLLGTERELWLRLATGEPGSPFNTPGLSLADGVAEYRKRWAEAAERAARRAQNEQ